RLVTGLKVNERGSRNFGLFNQHVYGGSISSIEYSNRFKHETRFHFSSGIASSEDYIAAFREVLCRYNIDPDHAAIWVEDESGYGASFRQTVQKLPKPPKPPEPREANEANDYSACSQNAAHET